MNEICIHIEYSESYVDLALGLAPGSLMMKMRNNMKMEQSKCCTDFCTKIKRQEVSWVISRPAEACAVSEVDMRWLYSAPGQREAFTLR